MKQSRFNMVVPYNEKYIYYNMLTKGIILSDKKQIDSDDPVFFENGFLIDDEIDEIRLAQEKLLREQDAETHLLLTIIPTLQCNLDCTYCYQHEMHNTQETISYDVLSGILQEIRSNEKLTSVHVDWNGGEPLLESDKINFFSQELISLCEQQGINYSASISSNLYVLNDSDLQILRDAKIGGIDTTLAGTEIVHDKYRIVRNSSRGSFSKVWENIKKASQIMPVAVCINLIVDSEPDAYYLIDKLALIANENLSITFLLIKDYGFGEKNVFLKKDEHFPIMIRLLKYAIDKGLKAEISSNFGNKFVFCAAQLKQGFIIHPTGRIYKCSDNYDINNSLGIVTPEGFLFTKKWIPINPYKDEKCKSCSIVAYCNGGCSYLREKGEDFCPREKDYLDDVLRLYVSSVYEL